MFFPRLYTFIRDRHGAMAKGYAIAACAAAIVCVVGAHAIDAAAKRGLLPEIVWKSRSIDYTATATIPALATTKLDPCTGKAR